MTMTLTLPTTPHRHLSDLRLGLVRLHKALLEFERAGYEKFYGRVSSGELLQLVIQHEWFDWLHPLSELIVQIDELLSGDEPVTSENAAVLIAQTQTLLTPVEGGGGFAGYYYNAMQNDVTAVLAHAETWEILQR